MYKAPEQYEAQPMLDYFKVDLWRLGLLIYYVARNRYPTFISGEPITEELYNEKLKADFEH